jgi:cysteine synthase
MTPLLRWGKALLKLEMFRPRGAVSDRAPAPSGQVELSGNQALSFAREGAELALRGAVTHEMREALKIWGARIVARAPRWNPDPEVFARTLGAELLEQVAEAPPLIVGPAGELAALAGALAALRGRWPRIRGVALVAAGEELPDLPRTAEVPLGIERVAVARADAAAARARLGRELGLLANHAGAAAASYAREHGGIALVTAPGEREFSLESAP